MNSRIFSYLIFFGLAGCQTGAVISSDPPGVSVFYGEKLLGATPLNISFRDLENKVADGYLFSLKMGGYNKLLLWIPDGISDINLAINMKPFIISQGDRFGSDETASSRLIVYQVTSRLLAIQNEVLSGNVDGDKSLKIISDLAAENPDLGTLYFLQSVLALRKGDLAKSKELLDVANRLSPREYDFLALYNIVSAQGDNKNVVK